MGTITDMSSAKLWLKSTFLWHRMKSNPSFYKLEGQTVILNIEQTLDEICEKDVKLLESEDLVCTKAGRIICTPCGHAMANYYVKFETMKTLLSLKEKAKVSDIVRLCQLH